MLEAQNQLFEGFAKGCFKCKNHFDMVRAKVQHMAEVSEQEFVNRLQEVADVVDLENNGAE